MFKPKYLIYLTKETFHSEQFVCLGSQTKSIVQKIAKLIGPHAWFCSDIDAISPLPNKLEINTLRLKKLGGDSSLMDLCEKIDQFLSGVFIAVKEKKQNLKNPELEVGTEDQQFRLLDLDGVLIEIRAFDTSYFEIYSEDIKLMQKLSQQYKVAIERPET